MYAAFNSYTAGSSSFKTSKTFTKPMINGNPQVVSPGSTHLIPLAEKLEKKLSGPINDYVSGEGENPLVITAESILSMAMKIHMHGTMAKKRQDSTTR